MSTIQEAIRSVQDYGDNFTKALERHRGFLGDGEGTVYVAERDGYVYVRNRQAESADITGTMEPEEVIYSRSDIPPIEGYPVIYGRDIDTEDFQLLATDTKQLLGWIFDKYIKDHHEQHEFNEFDTVWIQKQAMLPLLVYPTSPISSTLHVHQGWYQWDTDWHFFETTTSAELSSYIPVQSGKARFLLICIDGETETLYYESGDTFIIFLPPQDCEDRIPPPPEGKIPLAAIYLPYGTTSFDWDIIYDVRLLFSGGGSMSTGSAPRDAAYVTLAYNDILSAERLLSAGNGIVVTDNGPDDTVVVSLDDHNHAGDMSGDGGIIPGTSVELPEIPVATYDDVTDWFNTTQSAGCLSGGAITDNGNGTIDVAAGNGYIKTSDSRLGDTEFFDYPATAAPLTPTDNAKNWVYIDYNAGTPIVKVTDDKTILNRNTMFTIARLYREGNTLHITEKGQCAYNLSMRTHRTLVEVFRYQRASGLITAEKNARYLTVTAGEIYRGLNQILTSAIDTTLSGDSFTYYYRDGGGGWTTGTASQIDNVNYDDGSGVLEPVTVNQYGVFWIYVDFDGHLFVQYGQDSYKLAAAQEAMVPDPPDLLDGFAILAARVIVERNAANLEEIAYPWEEIFMPQAATDHNQLGNLQGGSAPDEYYHLDLAAYTQLSGGSGALPAVADEGYALVSTGVNTWGADLTPLWKGRHSFEDGIAFVGLTGNNPIVVPDGLVQALHIVDDTTGNEFLRIDTDHPYFLIDPIGDGINTGIGTMAPAGTVHIFGTSGTTELIIDCQGDTANEQASLHLLTLGDGTTSIGHADTKGWEISGRGDAWATVADQNELVFSFWEGAAWHIAAQIDPAGLVSVFNGISFEGATGDNEIFVLDNVPIALEVLDGGGLEYLRINSEDANPYLLIDPAGTGIKVGIGIADPLYVLDVRGTDLTPQGAATAIALFNFGHGQFLDIDMNIGAGESSYGFVGQPTTLLTDDAVQVVGGYFWAGVTCGIDHEVTSLIGVRVSLGKDDAAVVTTAYGVYINDIDEGATNYSIYSVGGIAYFGGDVGIGTATPGDYIGTVNLVLWDNTASGFSLLTLRSADDGIGGINFADADAGIGRYDGTIRYNHATQQLEIWTNYDAGPAGVDVTIDNTGQVGVGVQPTVKLDVLTDDAAGWAARFFNDGDNVNRYGIQIQYGEDTPAGTNYCLMGVDGDGDNDGGLYSVAGAFAVYNVSDERLKRDVVDTKVKGCEVVGQLKVRDFAYKKSPKVTHTGFLAQEVMDLVPNAVSLHPVTELFVFSNTMLIPVLAKAIQELDARLAQGGL